MKALRYILITLFLALVGLSVNQLASRKSIDLATPDYKKYEFKKGKQNAKPIESPLPYFFPKGFKMVVWMDSTAYWSLEDWENDKDFYDWNKDKGLTNAFTFNNHQSALIAWRPGAEHNTWEFSGYTNYPGSEPKYETKNVLTVKYGQPMYAEGRFINNTVRYMLTNRIDTVRTEHPFKRPLVAREIGTWIGGANNEEGEYGGKASKDMIMWIDFVKY